MRTALSVLPANGGVIKTSECSNGIITASKTTTDAGSGSFATLQRTRADAGGSMECYRDILCGAAGYNPFQLSEGRIEPGRTASVEFVLPVPAQ